MGLGFGVEGLELRVLGLVGWKGLSAWTATFKKKWTGDGVLFFTRECRKDRFALLFVESKQAYFRGGPYTRSHKLATPRVQAQETP